MKLKFKKLHAHAMLPHYSHIGDSGMDVTSIEDVTIQPHSFAKIDTGIAASIPNGYEIQVRPRSGLQSRGIVAAFGTVDSGYRGEIGIILYNHSSEPYNVYVCDRIAQLVVAKVETAEVEEVFVLDDTERGANGFGSTGK